MTLDAALLSALPGLAWPAVPSNAAAQKLALLFQIERSQWRPAEEIAADQFRQASTLIEFAAKTVPHYRRSLGAGFYRQDLRESSWASVPTLTRKGLHDARADLHSAMPPSQHGSAFPIRTSGSTGMVVEVLGTDLTNLFWQAFCLRDHLWHRRDLSGKLFAIRYLRDPAGKGAAGQRAAGWGPATDDVVRTGESVSYDILLPVELLAQRLLEEQPASLLAHPSMLSGLASYFLERGLALPGLGEVRSMGETIDDSLRARCREAWNAPLVDMYSCQEAGYLALQCPDHPHYHVQSENVLLEVVDARGRPCSAGEVGRVLVTCLNNFASPLIRYEIGDFAEVGEACPCGRGLPVLKRILGRYRNLLTMPDGTHRWPRLGYESSLQEAAPVELMQMVQTGPEDITVRLVAPRTLDDGETRSLTNFIHEKLGHPFRLRFEYVESIRNAANGKVEQFISAIA